MSTSEYSPLLEPIIEGEASGEREPLLKRKHLNKDCTHWVPLDYKTIIWGYEGQPDHDGDGSSNNQGSFLYRIFWSSKKRKRVTITITSAVGVTIALTAIAYFGYFRRSNLVSSGHGD